MYTMKESVAVAKEADAKKGVSPTRSEKSIHRVRDEPERQLGSLRDVIGNIRRDGGMPSVENIATELSGMSTGGRAPVLLALQQTHGNRYVQRVVSGIQAKLKVGQPGDIYEQEADRVAEEVMRMPEPCVQRQFELEVEEVETLQAKSLAERIMPSVQGQVEEEEEIQAKELSGHTLEISPNLKARINAIRGGGQPLPASHRAFFESRFGHDFSQVRLHTDYKAAEAARSVSAKAFTVGRDVVFGAGEYSPNTSGGRQLLAHELTHVVQQEHLSLPSINTNELDKEPTGSKNEQEADQLAKQFLSRNVEELSIKNMLMSDLMLLQCRCLPATACPTSIPGSPAEFEGSETTREAPHRTRRAQMVRSGSPLGSHGGRARQLEIFLDNQIGSDAVRTSNIHGIFVDQDLSEGTGAYLSPCNQITPPIPGATLPCVFVHGQMNRQASQFNQTTAPMIDGRTREEWRVDTLALLTHEVQHAIFGRWSSPTPGSVSGSCSWNHVEYSLSELSALMSEFPVYFREIPGNADAAHSARVRLNQWFDEVINNPYESIRGALMQLRCIVPCSCSDIDSYIRDTFDFTSSSWSQDEKDAFHRELLQRNLNWPMQPQTP